MGITLEIELINKLSHRGIMAYVAVSLAGDVEATTAVLAALVRVQTGVMLEGLKELDVEAPNVVSQPKKGKWQCNCGPGVLNAITYSDSSTRYAAFVDDLKKYWDHLNPEGPPFSMGGKDGAAIRRWLADHPNWEQGHWRKALSNRAKSVIVKSAPFFTWVPKLSEHAAEPLNEYNKPQEGTGKKGVATSVEEANRSARERVVRKAGNRS